MTSAANQDAYGWNQNAWGDARRGNASGGTWHQQANAQPWGGPPFWYPAGISRPAAIAFTILGFLFWWPVGLAILFYMIGTGRMGCFGGRRAMRRAMKEQFWRENGPWANWKTWAAGQSAPASSGNRAFDEYRTETLRRLEEEQKEFDAFLERLRFAKDKSEFDAFMSERRARPAAPPAEPPQAG